MGEVILVWGEYGGGEVMVSLYGDDAVELPMMPVCESGLIEEAVDCGIMGFKRSVIES